MLLAAIEDYSEALRLDPQQPTYIVDALQHSMRLAISNVQLRMLAKQSNWSRHRRSHIKHSVGPISNLEQFREGLSTFESGLSADPKNSVLLASISWILATCPDASIRDGSRALECACAVE